jgi:hypothetical protein
MAKAIALLSDALLACVILLLGVSLYSTVFFPTTSARSLTFAQDIMTILESKTVSSISDPWIQANSANATFDANNSLLIQVGQLWAQNNILTAQTLLNYTFNTSPFVPRFRILADGEVIYSGANITGSQKKVAWRIVSGLEKNKPIQGYVANAKLTQGQSDFVQVESISPQGAGWDTGAVNITHYFTVLPDTLINATLQASIHADASASDVVFNFNNGVCNYTRSSFTWFFGSDEGNVARRAVGSCLVPGNNKLTVYLNNNGYNAHTHPGLTLTLIYNKNITLEVPQSTVSKTYILDDIHSFGAQSGVWAFVPFTLPPGATNISLSTYIRLESVLNSASTSLFSAWDGTNKRRGDNDVLAFLNSPTPFYINASPQPTTILQWNYTQLRPYLVNGTNVLAIYANNYEDTVWGDSNTRLYSNPYLSVANSSRIQINYSVNISQAPYGQILVSQLQPFGSPNSADRTITYTYPIEAQSVSDTYVHLVQQYSDRIRLWASPSATPSTQLFLSPSSRAIPSTVFVSSNYASELSTNSVRVLDFGSTGNHFINISQVQKSFFIPSYVGYGAVFANQSQAIADAISRLNASVGSFLQSTAFDTQTNYVRGVTSLWGPVTITVESYQ